MQYQASERCLPRIGLVLKNSAKPLGVYGREGQGGPKTESPLRKPVTARQLITREKSDVQQDPLNSAEFNGEG